MVGDVNSRRGVARWGVGAGCPGVCPGVWVSGCELVFHPFFLSFRGYIVCLI